MLETRKTSVDKKTSFKN